jgi:hypothetical protein
MEVYPQIYKKYFSSFNATPNNVSTQGYEGVSIIGKQVQNIQ